MNRRSLKWMLAAMLAAGFGQWIGAVAAGGDGKGKSAPPDVRPGVGQVASPPGSLLLWEGKRGCRALRARAVVFAGDQLLALPGQRGEVDLNQGAVRLSLIGQPDTLGCAVTLHAPQMADLDFTLDRGHLLIANRASKGGVKVRVRFAEEVLRLELPEPGAEVDLDLLRMGINGIRSVRELKPDSRPLTFAFLVIMKGPVNVQPGDGTEQNGLGTGAYYVWNSLRGVQGPLKTKKLPAWRSEAEAPNGMTAKVLARYRQQLAKKDVVTALSEALRDKQPLLRKYAVYSLAVVGDLPAVLKALTDPKDRELRQAAGMALRHWCAQGSAHALRLYAALVKEGYRSAQAETVVLLLHTIPFEDVARRETYETLIDYLGSDRPAVRELAGWYLSRLASAEAALIPNDALGPPEQRAQAQAAWRKLLRAGKLPPAGAPK